MNYCTNNNLLSTFMFIGRIIQIAKIFIPIIIIGFGVMDLFKAITGSKDDEIKKSFKSLAMRCVAGVCVFFLPAIVSFIFSLVNDWNESDYSECIKCISNVKSCE